jgi:hypothetical protein
MSRNINETEGGETITPTQETVLVELLKGSTQREAAAVGQVTAETVSRWMNNDPVFIASYNQARASMLEAAVNEILDLRKEAIKALRDLVTTADPENEWIRLKAAQAVLGIKIPKIGPTDPADVESVLAKREFDLELSRLANRKY